MSLEECHATWMLEVQPTAPHLVLPILDEVGIIPVFCLKILEAAAEDEHLVDLVFALLLEEIAGLGVYLEKRLYDGRSEGVQNLGVL